MFNVTCMIKFIKLIVNFTKVLILKIDTFISNQFRNPTSHTKYNITTCFVTIKNYYSVILI